MFINHAVVRLMGEKATYLKVSPHMLDVRLISSVFMHFLIMESNKGKVICLRLTGELVMPV